MADTAPLQIGDPDQLGSYRLTGRLGEGGQGVVYLGEAEDGTQVAVKRLHAQFSGDAKARARFAGELTSAKRVAPFCTAPILDADVEGDIPYLVSEYVQGPSLREVVTEQGQRYGAALHRLAIGTVTALAAIHEAGIVHRDFKPTNVLLASDGPRVIDFGIARALDATGTLSSTAVGTPAYMAPEQISGAPTGPAADVFAWACTIVYAATGSPPFGQDSIPAVMNRILHAEPQLGMLMGPLREIVSVCLAKDPARRPTAQQILLRLLSQDGVQLPGATPSTAVLDQGAQAASAATPPPGWHPPEQLARPSYEPQDTPPPNYQYAPQYPPQGPPYAGMDTQPPGPYTPKPKKKRKAPAGLLVTGAVVVVLLVAGSAYGAVQLMSHHKDPTPGPGPLKNGGTVRMAMTAPIAIDPSNATTTADFFAVENLYTGLYAVGDDGKVRPALATSATSTGNDCAHWSFAVKSGTKFSNGEAVDAQSFVRSWNRTVRNKTGGEGYLMKDFQGYADTLAGKTSTMSGVTGQGTSLQVTLTKADCDLPNRLSAGVFVPMPQAAGEPSNTTYNHLPIGNGPFTVTKYATSTSLTLARNNSWALGRAHLDGAEVSFVSDPAQAVAGWRSGQFDWAEVSSTNAPAVLASNRSSTVKADVGGMTYMMPITDKAPFNNKQARQAMSYAIDRKAIVSTLYQGEFQAATSLVPPALGGVPNSCAACTFDPAKAKTLAAEAGLKPGSPVTLTYGDSSSYVQLSELIANQLKSNLGWNVKLRKLPLSQYYKDETGSGASGLYPLSWVPDYPSEGNYLTSLLSADSIKESGTNYAHYNNPAFDSSLTAARTTTDATKRTQSLQAAERTALDDMALIPLFPRTQYRLVNQGKLVGTSIDSIGYPALATLAVR